MQHHPRRVRRLGALLLVLVLTLAVPVALGCRDASDGNASTSLQQSEAATVVQPTASPSPAAEASDQNSTNRTMQANVQRKVSLTPVGQVTPGNQGFHGDVWAHNGVAYLGTWGTGGACPATGVKIIDLADPSAPRWIGTAAAIPSTTQEDIAVRTVSSRAFNGDLLAVGVQQCSFNNGAFAGLALFDVTDPADPVELGRLATGGRGVHELDLVQQGDRVLALLAVPDTEVRPGGVGDVRIVDVTDPRRPVQLAAWGAGAGLGTDLRGGIGCHHRIYAHSARASADGRRAYVSYWDAGVVVLDISDPAVPRVAGHLTYEDWEPGTTHSVAEAGGGKLLLIADEETVFSRPPGLTLQLHTDSGPLTVRGCAADGARPLDAEGVIQADLIGAGRACSSASLPEVRGRVALVDEGGCGLADKAAALAAQGARAMLLTQIGGPQSDPLVGARLPVVGISAQDGDRLKAALAGGTLPVTLPAERPWGGLRIWDIGDLNQPRQVAVYQTPNSVAFPAPNDGYFTLHNPEVAGDLAVLAWWTDGVRVVDISDPAVPREVAAYVPPAEPNPQRAVFPNQTLIWGVAILGDLVLASDVNGGLYVLRLTVE
jgi:hypothetical protein